MLSFRNRTRVTVRRAGIAFLIAQAGGAAAWWVLLIGWPESRLPFKAGGAPDVTLLAFGVADVLLFAGGSAASAYGLARNRAWAWPLLSVHAGAAAYASLYCWTLVALTGGDGWLGAALMSPSLVVPGWLVWRLQPATVQGKS